MLGAIVLCIFIAVVCSSLAWKRFKFCQIVGHIPGPLAFPIVGNALQFERESYEFLRQIGGWCEEYTQGLYCIWLGRTPFIVIYKPEFAEAMLTNQKNISKAPAYKVLHPWLGTGLLTRDLYQLHNNECVDGAKWKSRRRLLTSTFHFKILNNFISVYQKQADILVERLKVNAGKEEFDLSPFITLCVLDIICEAAMGVHVNAQSDSDSKYVSAVLSMSELVQKRQKAPWLWFDVVYNLTSSGKSHRHALDTLHGFTNKVIDDRITERKQRKETESSGVSPIVTATKSRILAFLDLLLEEYDQGHISRDGVREEVDTFMFEGHDTTAASLLWSLHLVGKHPDVQSKLHNEVDSFYDSLGEVVTSENLKHLPYLECVLKEALRLFPSVPLLGREVTEDIDLGSYVIPKGCSVAIVTGALHRDPDTWSDPETFDPERFLLENVKGRHPFAYVPFSAGPRNCIGQKFALMEEKIVLSSILRNFTVHSLQTTQDIKSSGELILRSIEGIWVKLELRRH